MGLLTNTAPTAGTLQARKSSIKPYSPVLRMGTTSYRGFAVSELRSGYSSSGDGFRLLLKGKGEQEFQPDNLIYAFEEKFSLSGMFQRLDNFLEKGLEQAFRNYQANVRKDMAELETVKAALGQEFPQKDDLTLVRENHGAVMRELKRMQDEPGYVSDWEPKKGLAEGTSHSCEGRETLSPSSSQASVPRRMC